MRKRKISPRLSGAILFLSLAAAASVAADPEAKKNPVPAGGFAVVRYKLDKGESVTWEVTPDPVEFEEFERDGQSIVHFSGLSSDYKVTAWIVNFDTRKQYKKRLDISFAQNPKPPPIPIPPGPTPGPAPTPSEANPFGDLPGLHVLIVYEEKEKEKYPVTQFLILQGQKFRDYVNAKCVKDGYRFFDKDVMITTPGSWFDAAMKKTDRTKLPWLYVGSGKFGYSGPLPLTADETITLSSRFEGK